MSRYIYQDYIQDGNGVIVASASIVVYLAGTTTLATIYSAESGGSAVSGSTVTSDSNGFFSFYIDTDDYAADQLFKITWSKTGYTGSSFDNLRILWNFRPSALDDYSANDTEFQATVQVGTGASRPTSLQGELTGLRWSIAAISGGNYYEAPIADISEIATSITTNISDISKTQTSVSNNISDISEVQTSVGTNTTNISARKILQSLYTSTTTADSTATQIPSDDTKPQKTEGKELMTLAITPSSATNKIHIMAIAPMSTNISTVVDSDMTLALFKDSDTDAIASAIGSGTDYEIFTVVLVYEMTAGTTDEITFKIRFGTDAVGTCYVNSNSGAAIHDGIFLSSMTIQEISA